MPQQEVPHQRLRVRDDTKRRHRRVEREGTVIPTSPDVERELGAIATNYPDCNTCFDALLLAQHLATLAWAAAQLREKAAKRRIRAGLPLSEYGEGVSEGIQRTVYFFDSLEDG